MTRTRLSKTGTTDAVELNDAALDRAAGGITPLLHKALVTNEVVQTIKDGTSNTLVGIDYRP